ncbi:MAG: isopentenyl-diphosphate Delta-isomerase [Gammaproteobacteria bacterium]|nr:isopentenyl-diphosphate Delta-isomerase [Gammaproteobacteria bacterium]
MQQHKAQKVSFDDELLILVDDADNVTGYENKLVAHRGSGLLHRAFSIFLFNANGEVLLHKRSDAKPLWPGFWTNSCCSHPRKGETYSEATRRRLHEELGVSAELGFLYQFRYSADFAGQGSENELCAVYAGTLDDQQELAPNVNEIADWCWVSCSALDAWLSDAPERFTPWFKLEWGRLRSDQQQALARLCRADVH